MIIKYENDAHLGTKYSQDLLTDQACARYYLHMAFKKFDECCEELKHNSDKETYDLADLLTGL